MLKYVTASFVLTQTSVSVQPSLRPAALIPVLFATKARFGIVHRQETGQDTESHLALQSSSCLLNVLSVAVAAPLYSPGKLSRQGSANLS